MTLLQQFLSTVWKMVCFLSVDHYVWAPARAHGGRPRNGTAETREGSCHMWRKPSFPGMYSAHWALSSLLCWQSLSLWSDNPGFLHSGQGAVLKVGRYGPFPQATAWSWDPESISSYRKKKKRIYTRNDCFYQFIVNRSETSLYDFS